MSMNPRKLSAVLSSSGDAPNVLQLVEAPLDKFSQAVEFAVDRTTQLSYPCDPGEHFFSPLVQALARQLGSQRGLAVNLGVDPEHNLPRIGLLRFLADPGACFDVIFNSLMEGFAQPFHCVGMKAHPVTDTGNPARENPVFIVILDPGGITLVGHGVGHGFIPIRSRKSRASRIWYRFASFTGCGRWNVATSPSFSNRTRDPRPSIDLGFDIGDRRRVR